MKTIARIDEFDPVTADTGRFEKIQALCELGGTPRLAMYMFESGTAPDDLLHIFARNVGVLPPRPPFPDLLAYPEPRVSD